MSADSRKVLVTGAAGNLGQAVCRELTARGHVVRGTDRKFAQTEFEFLPGDLLDEFFVHRVLHGCDAVVHLGNHPNRFAGPSDQRLLSENVAMNANVFFSAIDRGVRSIVFASSIQAMLRAAGNQHDPPYPIPYLPIDGAAPADPALNPYAMSKVFGEEMLRVRCEHVADLSATALRLPMLPLPWWVKNLTESQGIRPRNLNLAECLAHLMHSDAARLFAVVLEKNRVGYHQYLPAVSTKIEGLASSQLISDFYPEVPLRQPAAEIDSLIDISALERDLNWSPRERMHVKLRRD